MFVLCCAVLCCAVLCCAVLCCAVLCCAVLCCAVLCCAVLCCAVLCCAVLCCAVLCCAVLCCAVLCCKVLSLICMDFFFLLKEILYALDGYGKVNKGFFFLFCLFFSSHPVASISVHPVASISFSLLSRSVHCTFCLLFSYILYISF